MAAKNTRTWCSEGGSRFIGPVASAHRTPPRWAVERVSGVTSATRCQLKSTLEKPASLSILWRAFTSRTVPDLDRITSDWVVAPRLS